MQYDAAPATQPSQRRSGEIASTLRVCWRSSGAAALCLLIGACHGQPQRGGSAGPGTDVTGSATGSNAPGGSAAAAAGVLLARPASPALMPPSGRGIIPLGLSHERDGFLYVPNRSYTAPVPLVVFLHGSGGDASQAAPLLPLAEGHGVLILSVDSRGPTWDMIIGELGADAAFMDRALRLTFGHFPIDPAHVALSGFSDGASYALSLGLANGDLFTHVLAFSPGFAAPPRTLGRPRVFVSHGVRDRVLPCDRASARAQRLLCRISRVR
jgi:phospholipase/carboxylesterase